MQTRMLAVAFGPASMAEARTGLARIREVADCVELRLDFFQEPFDLDVLLRERGSLTAVVTLRARHEGGRCDQPANERLKILLRAAELGAEYVDLEWDAASSTAVAALRAAGAQVIVSRHDFAAMPSLEDWTFPNADVVKVVGTAHDVRDCLPVFRVLARAERPTIAIAMGEAGLPTRVLPLRSERCLLTYASLDTGTAPGQINVDEMRNTYRVNRLRSTTRVFGLLGPHVERDRLAEYNAWFADDTFDGVAVPFVAHEDASGIVAAFRELPMDGWHIHGEVLQRDVLRVLDDARGDKVNAVVREPSGALTGDWVESPREQYELWLAASDAQESAGRANREKAPRTAD